MTYDCWNTLLRDASGTEAQVLRRKSLRRLLGCSDGEAQSLLQEGWARHDREWRAIRAFGPGGIAEWCARSYGIDNADVIAELTAEFEAASLAVGVEAVAGSREVLEALAAAGIRRGLVCDTGFTPGHLVRQLLARVDLLDLLEVCAFSDEVGLPKPAAETFHAALDPLAVSPADAVHVGDLRRTDVAGAQAIGMRAARFRGEHDDGSAGPEGDWVLDRHGDLLAHLGIPAERAG